MAYKTSLVAISWHQGEYEVVDQTSDGNISLDKLKKKGIVHDVSDDLGYIDAGAIIRKCDFPKYYVASNDPYYDVTKTWFKKLPKQTEFIFAHFAEYGDNLTIDLMNIK